MDCHNAQSCVSGNEMLSRRRSWGEAATRTTTDEDQDSNSSSSTYDDDYSSTSYDDYSDDSSTSIDDTTTSTTTSSSSSFGDSDALLHCRDDVALYNDDSDSSDDTEDDVYSGERVTFAPGDEGGERRRNNSREGKWTQTHGGDHPNISEAVEMFQLVQSNTEDSVARLRVHPQALPRRRRYRVINRRIAELKDDLRNGHLSEIVYTDHVSEVLHLE
ncbi:lisH domain-containing protein C1711.05-like [Haliotis rubra]|uniref:lisH domain-containing protein C1711.05-like n=1 Tax=Haliotis rubra TaxID=36100 RepID=UPI001EE5BF69|nr:lisH domain-containing protein C1711.05-like [Haliotis rubra]